jgi:3',5'-cyclic AMP phosphodiesterase CpdA
MLRLIHFSDIHLFQSRARWKARDLFSKRVTGYVNSRYMPRSKEFKQAAHVLHRLVEDAYSRQPDLIIFSGDATTLGVEEEFAHAAELLQVGKDSTPPALAVPGNHDYYTTSSVKQGLFERHFAPWQQGERIDDSIYPFAQTLGHLFIVGVNSCQWNRWSWDSTGRVGIDQLLRLERLLASDAARERIKIMVTHYPLALANGKPERRHRRLRDLHDLLAVAQRHGVQLWLHGHRHKAYVVPAQPDRPVAALCVGSGTMHDHWSYGEYLFQGEELTVRQYTYQPDAGRFAQTQEQRMRLSSPSLIPSLPKEEKGCLVPSPLEGEG